MEIRESILNAVRASSGREQAQCNAFLYLKGFLNNETPIKEARRIIAEFDAAIDRYHVL